jgi:hypothetical protein
MENSMEASQNLKIELPYEPAIPLLRIYPKECKLVYNKSTCTLMFTAALFPIAKLWRQPRCPTTDECIQKMYLYAMEFCSVTKTNEIALFVGKCMELENIMLSKLSQVQKAKSCVFSLIYGI